MSKLNLGSGQFKKEGYVNVDLLPNADVVHNLNDFPYPFPDNSFDEVEGDHVLEHLQDPFETMKELVRVTKSGGLLSIRVPHFSRGFTHPDHKRGFDVSFPLYFDPSFIGGYSGTPLELVRMRLTWFAQPYLKRKVLSHPQYLIGSVLGSVFDFLANLSPYACSRIWCFWVGGFEEVSFQLRCVKK